MGKATKGSLCELLACLQPFRGSLLNLSDELSRLRVDMVGLSETKRPDSGETNSKGFTHYWSGMCKGYHVKGVNRNFQRTAPISYRDYSD